MFELNEAALDNGYVIERFSINSV